jgi:Ca-activated chloride channel family protein
MLGSTAMLFLLVVGLVAGVYLLLGAGERKRAKSGKGRKRRASTYRSQARWARVLPLALLAGAVACLAIALAQFRITQTGTPGTVMLTMDVSQSMNQTDVKPDRLAAATSAAQTFLTELPADYPVGLVTFSDTAQVLVPPTAGRDQASVALGELSRGKGTVIGDGLAASLDEIRQEWDQNGRRASAVILLSDGRDTGSQTSPQQAAQEAATLEVPVYTVVLGVADSGTKQAANAELLEEIASTTGAQSFTAGTASELTQIYDQLGTQLSTQLKISNSAALFVGAAVALAIGAALTVLVGSRSDY